MRPSPGAAPDAPLVQPLHGRDRFVILSCLVIATGLSWAYLVHLDREMSASMAYGAMMADMGMSVDHPWAAADVGFTIAMWAVMMVGMMAGSAAPVLLLFGAARRSRGDGAFGLAVSLFALGYLIVWVGFSVCAALVQWVLHEEALLTPAMAASSSRIGGAILIAAGIYQLTPVKDACLAQCRSPLGFLMTNWRDGDLGALRMGARHGWFCLGCCWALMSVLFVVGVMNLVWVAALTLLVLAEKIGPAGARVGRVAAVLMIAIGLALTSL